MYVQRITVKVLFMMHSSGHKADGDGIVTDTPETGMHHLL
jgi:hypothetical protein